MLEALLLNPVEEYIRTINNWYLTCDFRRLLLCGQYFLEFLHRRVCGAQRLGHGVNNCRLK